MAAPSNNTQSVNLQYSWPEIYFCFWIPIYMGILATNSAIYSVTNSFHYSTPGPNMLKILPISYYFQHFPESYPLVSSCFHIITCYSHIILYTLLFQVLTSRETWTWYILCCSYCVYISVMYMQTYNASNMVSESHPCLSLNSSLMLPLILILSRACEHPKFLKLCLGVSYNSQNYACKNIVTYNSQNYAGTLGSGLL